MLWGLISIVSTERYHYKADLDPMSLVHQVKTQTQSGISFWVGEAKLNNQNWE